jgi:glutamine amidotransferase
MVGIMRARLGSFLERLQEEGVVMSQIMITMIDYGGSNLRSAQKAFEHVGAGVLLTSDPELVIRASKLVLPGVGAFGAGMKAIKERGLDAAVRQAVSQGTPLLGICLGMQFLFDESDEMGQHAGLGLIPGRVTRFSDDNLKVPHMGWNAVEHSSTHPLLTGVPDGAYTYFVHSYYCIPASPDFVIARTHYGRPFASIVGNKQIFGIQFHPEKSQQVGLRIIRNFACL